YAQSPRHGGPPSVTVHNRTCGYRFRSRPHFSGPLASLPFNFFLNQGIGSGRPSASASSLDRSNSVRGFRGFGDSTGSGSALYGVGCGSGGAIGIGGGGNARYSLAPRSRGPGRGSFL